MSNLPKMTPAYLKQLQASRPFKAVTDADGGFTGHVITGPVRLSFVYLEKPKEKKSGGKVKFVYAFTGLIPPGTDVAPAKAVIQAVGTEKWPKFIDMARRGALVLPIKSQDANARGENKSGKAYKGFEVGGLFFDAQRSVEVDPPVMVGPDLQPLAAKEFYSGCWAIVKLRAFYWEGEQQNGISFGVDSLIKVADDDKLGGEGGNALDGMDAIVAHGATNGTGKPADVGNSATDW